MCHEMMETKPGMKLKNPSSPGEKQGKGRDGVRELQSRKEARQGCGGCTGGDEQ